MTDGASRIACGGALLFPLPAGPVCAGRARALLCSTMRSLGLPDGLVEDGALAVSELATNSYLHAVSSGPDAGAELWCWSRTLPHPQLVVSVFDGDRATMPRPGSADLLDEHGKGLAVVQHVAAAWGAHPSRSRLTPAPLPGKRVWFSLTLPTPWHWTKRIVSPSLASKRLVELLRMRGVDTTRTSDDKGVALVTAGHLNIWVEPEAFAWCDGDGGHVRYPHLDLQDAAEHLVAALEAATARPPAPPGEPSYPPQQVWPPTRPRP